jgi:hypothetical protein
METWLRQLLCRLLTGHIYSTGYKDYPLCLKCGKPRPENQKLGASESSR